MHLKSPWIPFRIVAFTFSDNLSQNSCILADVPRETREPFSCTTKKDFLSLWLLATNFSSTAWWCYTRDHFVQLVLQRRHKITLRDKFLEKLPKITVPFKRDRKFWSHETHTKYLVIGIKAQEIMLPFILYSSLGIVTVFFLLRQYQPTEHFDSKIMEVSFVYLADLSICHWKLPLTYLH